MPGVYRLKGTVKHYDWGGTEFIPALLNKENGSGRPYAEYWLGTHPLDHSMIEFPDKTSKLLKDHLQQHPELLGKQTQEKFGHLPYLLKLLDVKDMLSIQVHPSKADAEKEFARENQEGIPIQSSNRNYKDDNHKPELMVALNDFWLLHGFKSEAELLFVLKAVAELNSLLPIFENSGIEELYRHVMEMPQAEVNKILQPLIDRIIPLYQEGKLAKDQIGFWVARAAIGFNQPDKIDRGIFSIYFFNLLQLKKGQGLFQPAGLPHAYLEGQNVEIMASSDNVLRGGLTTKHIDVKELLKHVKCEPASVEIIEGELKNHEKLYDTPAPDFKLTAIELQKDQNFRLSPSSAEILLLVEGAATVKGSDQSIPLEKGNPSAICFPGEAITLAALEDARIFRASVP